MVVLVLVVGLTATCRRKNQLPSPAPPATTSHPQGEPATPAPPPFYVLVWVESTPPGARVVRLSDGMVLARTPETVELLQSQEPVAIRIEMDGYIPVTREVPAAADGTVTVSLEPLPRRGARDVKDSKHGK